MDRLKNINKLWLIPIALLLGIGLYYLPPINNRLAPRVEQFRSKVYYFFNPPSEQVFQPSSEDSPDMETAIAVASTDFALSLTPESTSTPQPGPTLTPTVTTTPIPATVNLPGVVYVDQHNRWNYCGPANLTMALNFWGWTGNRDDVAMVVKPGSPDMSKTFIERGLPDKNVMPYEMVDFVNEHTEYRSLMRYGGDQNLIKRLIAAGFPVVIEKGYYERDASGVVSWLGHYLFTTGYDDARGGFIVQDAYLEPGKDLLSDYPTYQKGWREFNYVFMVVYPADREAEVLSVLGPWADERWAVQHALELAEQDILTLKDNNLFYAWFNKGTSHVNLQQYADAAIAYDQAFATYANWDVEKEDRPYRMMWFQTGPYFAYYYTARYQDVIELANTTLSTISVPTLEESLLWRGRAYYMIGQTQPAIEDYRAALGVHKDWMPAVQALQELGVQP